MVDITSGDRETSEKVPSTLAPQNELAQAYIALKRQYENFVERNVAGVFITNADGRFLECNEAMARIMGYANKEELIALPASVLYMKENDRRDFLEVLGREKKLVNYESVLKHRSGRAVHVLENVILDEPEGGPPVILGTLMDITPFRQTELEQEHLMSNYRSLVEHIRDGLLVLVDGLVKYANPAVEELVGMFPVGKYFATTMHPDDAERATRILARVGPYNAENAVPLRTCTDREVLMFAVHTMHEGRPAVQITLQDHGAQRSLLQERLRLQMAEEVNEVLRQEIAEHRRTQEALDRSRQFARSLVESSLDMIMAADPQGRITEYNPAASLRFGWEPEEVIGLSSEKLYADPVEYERVQKELLMHGAFSGEIHNISRDGKVFTSFLAASRLYDEKGQVIGAMGVSRDITRMKRDQEALKASEERYRDLFENATDLIQSVDVDGRFQYVNNAWYKTLGYSPEELNNMRLMDIVHPAYREKYGRLFDSLFSAPGPRTVETVFIAKDGSTISVEGTSNVRVVDGRPVATRSIFRDITTIHQARQRVQEHEAKLRALFESSEHMFWTVDQDIKLTSYNHGYAAMIERLHGVKPEINNDPKKPRKRFASEEYHSFWDRKYEQALRGSPMRFETELMDRHGQRVCNEIFLSPVFDLDGRVKEIFGVGHEITEQKVAEDKVRDQAARLQAIFDSSANMMIWTLDKDLRITSCNAHFRRSIEQDFDIRLDVGDLFVVDPAKQAAGKQFKHLLERYQVALKGKPQQFEAELKDKQGRTIWVENFLNPIVVDGVVQEISCLAYGITDRKEAQIELLHSLREKEVLLKEVHHRVKNNLQIVSSIFSLQTAHVGDDQRVLGLLRDSRDRIRSMSYIHESLYQNKDFSSIDLADYIEGLSRNLMMSYSLSGKVELRTHLEPVELVLDQAIPCGLILNELISNALKHAFPGQTPGAISIDLTHMDGLVRITVADNGPGFNPGFDPATEGNLGLELVRTLIDQLDGTLQYLPDKGVRVLLTFERTK